MRKVFSSLCWLAAMLSGPSRGLAEPVPDLSHVGVDSHLYLRCNATSWDLSEASRLKPGSTDFLQELRIEIKEPWMLSSGDECVLTETPDRNAWGAWHHNYGGHLPSLKVPDSLHLRAQTSPQESAHFKVTYPELGRYVFTLNTRDGYFTIRKDAKPQPGEVLWTLPGNAVSDHLKNMFLLRYYPKNSLSLVDPASGTLRWTLEADAYVSLYGTCSTSDHAFVTAGGRVLAVSLKDGRTVWSSDLDGALQDTYPFLSCYPNSDQVYLSYGTDSTTLVGLDKARGTVLWSWTAPAYAAVMGVDAQRIFVNTYKEAQTSLKVLNKFTGREEWHTPQNLGSYNLTEDGTLLLTHGSKVSALAPDTGATLWTYASQTADSIWLSFEQDRLFVHEQYRISVLDKRQGKTVWTYDYNSFAAQYPMVQILKSGVVLLRTSDYTSNMNRQLALDAKTGRTLWEREEFAASSFLGEDNRSGTWLINGKTISALDPWSGQTRWNYVLQDEHPRINIFSVIESDDATVYVSYGVIGVKYPPMGILALDAKAGSLRWQSWLDASLYRVSGTEQALILNAGYYGSTKALMK